MAASLEIVFADTAAHRGATGSSSVRTAWHPRVSGSRGARERVQDLEDLDVGNREAVSARDILLAMLLETAGEEGHNLIEVALPSSHILLACLQAKLSLETELNRIFVVLFEVVEGRVNLPHSLGLSGVVPEADAEGTQDGVRLADSHAVLFPDGQSTQRQVRLQLFELLGRDAVVLVVVVSEEAERANALTASTNVEIS
eukprot:CAMPEP_0185582018 /NCGR_PEP_ID=MMETSP0434-20130131/19618_1 /TAXON_ID=626734 ORGANISM="Favella taraikaensis, Strain Fe Narragansett Bay" /NCGR_SAMPLE_ID=MMETSP0434 /ASSEMBLY_ACC=CAM_ASM_000379 /LENGTH=199 /DNA_ID=CAMNT_0028200711 /DNA_START=108 /DNA_END=708 /DNA_ORIENTATION=+